jgi:UDP-hydrolysing UDP-N-acetyl-D-glucosamine 2-epimerase
MMSKYKKKILALSSIRSDYDLMSGLYRLLASDSEIDFRVLVSGAHLSRSYGLSVTHIRSDGLKILAEIESLIDGDSISSRLKTASILLQCAIDIVANWAPDLILYAGDREDVLIGAMLGVYLGIPTVHFFGGDHEKDGHSDTMVRHAASKLSTAHVVSIEEHRNRLIAIGETPERIFVAGSVALDKFIDHQCASISSMQDIFRSEKQLDGYALVIFHPVDCEKDDAGRQFECILQSLEAKGIPACISYPNTDPGNHMIINVIRSYENHKCFWFYKNLDRDVFLSVYKNARFLIGNSSSGIQEAASIPLGVINVGLRQKGRYCGQNVIFCDPDRLSVEMAIDTILSPNFNEILSKTINPYGNGRSCHKSYKYLKETDFWQMRLKIEDPLDVSKISIV